MNPHGGDWGALRNRWGCLAVLVVNAALWAAVIAFGWFALQQF